nr:hypothetical protein [Patescibacteria group bacterium]
MLQKFTTSLIVILTFSIFSLTHVFATSSLLKIQPSFQEITITENDVQKQVLLTIENTTLDDITFTFDVLDIRQVDLQGNIGLVEKPTSNDNPKAWFIDTPDSVLVKSNENKEVIIHIKNSIDLLPGGHYVAVVAKSSQQANQDNFQVFPALSTFLLVKKEGGELYQLVLKKSLDVPAISFSFPRHVTLTFENTGNVHVKPYGLVTLSDAFNRVIRKGIINESSQIILPAAQREYIVPLRTLHFGWPFMLYRLTVTGHTDFGNVEYNESTSFLYVSP